MAVHRSQLKKKKKGPAVSVPGTKKAAPLTGRSSFAKRVKTRRRKAEATATARPQTASNGDVGKPKKQPTLLTREERLAVAHGHSPVGSAKEELASPAPAASVSIPAAKKAPPKAPAAKTSQPARPKQQRDPDDGFVAVGRILGPFGLKGEMKVQSLTDNPDRFTPKARLYAGQQLVTVAAAREAAQHIYITLKGFADRTSVEKFRGALLQVPESELPELEEGEYYRFQIVGLEVFDRTGAKLGVVADVLETGATDVYRVTTPEGPELLLAATPDVIVEVDLKKRRMTVDPPAWT